MKIMVAQERDVERYLVKGIRKMGGIAYKFVSPGNTGVPDRICVLPGGHVIFVELKTTTGQLSAIQQSQLKRLHELNAICTVLYGMEDVKKFLDLEETLSKVSEGEDGI